MLARHMNLFISLWDKLGAGDAIIYARESELITFRQLCISVAGVNDVKTWPNDAEGCATWGRRVHNKTGIE